MKFKLMKKTINECENCKNKSGIYPCPTCGKKKYKKLTEFEE